MHQILRFEHKILAACEDHLRKCLDHLKCSIGVSILLVGLDARGPTVLPTEGILSAQDIQKYFTPPQDYPSLPGDHLERDEWQKGYQHFEQQCWTWWQELTKAISDAIADRGMIASLSPPVEVEGKVVALAAIFNESDLMRYPSVSMEVFRKHGRWPSLHFGVIEAVLNLFAEELDKRNPCKGKEFVPFDVLQTVRVAGEFFLRMHSWADKRFSELDIRCRGTLRLFDECSIISSFPYERRDGFGSMIIADRLHPALETILEYRFPMLINSHRRVRKLLEMCSDGLSILCDSRYAWGLGRFDSSKYDSSKMDICTVEFKGNHHWQMSHMGKTLMDVKHGNPDLPNQPMDLNAVHEKLKEKFGEAFDKDILNKVVNTAVHAQHGTVVVISNEAESECKRIVGDVGIKPFSFDEKTIAGAMSIDGAIMLDPLGVCHGVGLILDGTIGKKENPARGARYNSVRRYMNNHSDCVIVVVSEDGMIDLFPDE